MSNKRLFREVIKDIIKDDIDNGEFRLFNLTANDIDKMSDEDLEKVGVLLL